MSSDWIFTEAELRATPSQRDGMKYADELLTRKKACDFIEKMAKALDLPKLAQISADNFLHRFFMRQSLVRFDKYLVSAACVLLGSKAEESLKKVSKISEEYIAVRKVVEKDQVFAIQKHDPAVIARKIISMEGVVLHALAYELTLTHPYKYINEKVDKVVRLQTLTEAGAKSLSGKIKQVAWSFLNDSAYTLACLRLEAVDLAAGAVYLAGLYESYVPADLCTPEKEPWWTVLSTPVQTLQDAARYLLEAYTEPYIRTQVLPAGLSKLVYMYHPPKRVESPVSSASMFADMEFEVQEHSGNVSSPMDSALCVTSPECGGSQGRSPFDHDFDHDLQSHKDGDESPRETAQVPGAVTGSSLASFPRGSYCSSADQLPKPTRKRGKEPSECFVGKKSKLL